MSRTATAASRPSGFPDESHEREAAVRSARPKTGWAGKVFSFPVVLAAALMLTLFLLATESESGTRILSDPDIWWHLQNARDLLTTRHFIRTETHTFTVSGKPWIDPEWLAEVPYYFGYRWLGDRGLFFVMMGAAELIVLGVFLLSWMRSRDVKASFLASWVAVMLASVSLGPRTLLLGWLFLVVELAVLWTYREGRDFTWVLPPLMCLWINTHGSWLIGFVLMLVFAASGFLQGKWGAIESPGWNAAQRRKWLLACGLSFAALFLNPYGWRLVVYPFDLAFQQKVNLAVVEEWASLNFHELRGKILLGTLLAMAVLNLVRRRTWLLSDLLFAAIVIYGGVSYSRFVFLAGIVLSPMFAIDLRGALGPYDAKQDRAYVNAAALSALLALLVWRNPSRARLHEGVASFSPESAMPQIQQLPPDARVLNYFEWGGYLMWNSPHLSLFVDSRTDIFDHEGVLLDYARALEGLQCHEVLDKYRIGYVLLPPTTPLSYVLAHDPHWKTDYRNARTVLFERRAS